MLYGLLLESAVIEDSEYESAPANLSVEVEEESWLLGVDAWVCCEASAMAHG